MRKKDLAENAISLHQKLRGKIAIQSKLTNLRPSDLQLIYTPGVAEVCKKIHSVPSTKFVLTSKSNNVAIITDGTRILGLGDIGPDAALPVMEGKSVIYRHFGAISAFPICLSTTKKSEIVKTILSIEPVFGAINLEDIEFPKVLDISIELEKRLAIPVFHDDRHGTAVVALAALINALKLTKQSLSSVKIVVAGAGSAGYGISSLLSYAGCKNILVVDSGGAIYKGRTENMNKYKKEISTVTNPSKQKGTLSDVMINSDVFIGVSGQKNLVSGTMIQSMGKNPIVLALTNPDPEIAPNIAKKAGAKIVGTGSYEFENKVNNAVVFPYLMRAILDLGIKKITNKLLYLSALAIANTIPKNDLDVSHIIPELGNKKLQKNIMHILKSKYKKHA
ncbi:NAD(P)-dependent malic enzyme [Candidatus Nitrosotenuis cloacae]|uniref:Malate dehydrogenase n=1 Tax=Candidatus Nitrosotenuis cloacae TaxID=1603555 RepID=A0A3G1B630_9ARCH|nr:malic enzyme-like NAD(P)-binding protein [Candidatus Nitrosotenuis cloacae]AJZ75437.1 malate dehydrogenase [Candidatus Nitrosotenuis cloacae]